MKIQIWPSFLVLLLGANVGIVAVTMTLANRDGGPAISPDYDVRALHWDEFRKTQLESDSLGWNAAATLNTQTGRPGELSLRITDRTGAPVPNTILVVTLFHNAFPNHPSTYTISTDADGLAITPIDFHQQGLFTLHIESAATQSRPRFMLDLELAANLPPSAPEHPLTLDPP